MRIFILTPCRKDIKNKKLRSKRKKNCVCHVVHHFKFRPDDAMRIRNEPLHSSPSTWRHQRKMMLEKFSEKWKVKEGSREMKNRMRNVFNLLKFFSTKIAYLSSHSRECSLLFLCNQFSENFFHLQQQSGLMKWKTLWSISFYIYTLHRLPLMKNCHGIHLLHN